MLNVTSSFSEKKCLINEKHFRYENKFFFRAYMGIYIDKSKHTPVSISFTHLKNIYIDISLTMCNFF